MSCQPSSSPTLRVTSSFLTTAELGDMFYEGMLTRCDFCWRKRSYVFAHLVGWSNIDLKPQLIKSSGLVVSAIQHHQKCPPCFCYFLRCCCRIIKAPNVGQEVRIFLYSLQ
uniref:Uncharacterized protein n=1 Tax=Cacopsylla melanoneura TaxID=428564 RepID=A0A8D9EAS0_9HEMI